MQLVVLADIQESASEDADFLIGTCSESFILSVL